MIGIVIFMAGGCVGAAVFYFIGHQFGYTKALVDHEKTIDRLIEQTGISRSERWRNREEI